MVQNGTKKAQPPNVPPQRPSSWWRRVSPLSCITHLLFGAFCFQSGLIVGSHQQDNSAPASASSAGYPDHSKFANLGCPPEAGGTGGGFAGAWQRRGGGDNLQRRLPLFPPAMGDLFAGAARVNRTNFVQHVDVGVPVDHSRYGNEEVLLLYGSEDSYPDGVNGDAVGSGGATASATGPLPYIDDAGAAVANCLAVKVLLLQPNRPDHCLAIVGQWESHHLHLFRRIPKVRPRARYQNTTPAKEHALRFVDRGVGEDGKEAQGMGMPTKYATKEYWSELIDYLNKQEDTLQRLQPIVQEAAGSGRAVVVMLVNFGQVSLFMNFVCAARARGLDLSNIVMFATDPPAVDIATSLGVKVFDVQDAFGYLPQDAARIYGDMAFKRMMLAKVYCVHLVVLLGYDVLFQDVDMTWYRNPIEYFRSPKMREFDMVFQDDGARSARYAPWSPNTGLYFVRNTPRSVFFFNMFCRLGDVILKYRSHQGVMTALINEHVSWKGLRVKVLGKDTEDGFLFPGGYHFHRRRDFMRRMVRGEENPYLFHMSWTENKDNKLLFLKQLGEWFVQPSCTNKTLSDLDVGDTAENPDLTTLCCSAQPLVECHYRDKPSKIPCRKSPPIDKGKRSFW